MKNNFISLLLAGIMAVSLISLNSCRKDFTLDEFSNMNNDSLHFEGSLAGPIVNTELKLVNFIPANDSSLWLEVDGSDLVHIRMYYKNLVSLQMRDIYSLSYPASGGTLITASINALRTDTSKMKLYNNVLSGKLFFSNPSISFIITNQIPVVTFFKIDTLNFYNSSETAISYTPHIEYPIAAPTTINTEETTTITIDTLAIPNLANVFSPVPKFIGFYVSTGSHIDQNLPFAVTGDERINVDVDIDLPMDARLDTVVMADTLAFNWNGDTYNQIKSATLKIRLNNGFPIDGYSQIYFADTTSTGEIGTLIDSVFTDITVQDISGDGWHLKPAQTDAQGIVTFSDESEITIFLDQERVNFLKNSHASKMIIVGKLNTFDSNTGLFIKILGSYKMGVQIAVKADFETTAN